MDFAWLVKIVAALVLVAVIAIIFVGFVAKAIFDKDLPDLLESKQRIIIGWSADINSDRTVALTWETKEKEIGFVVYEMHETKPESTPSEPKFELSSITPVKPKTEKEKWTWTSSKLQAGSHFFVIVPIKNGEEINEESSKEINANFYDDKYVDREGNCEGNDADKCRAEFEQNLIDMGFAQI